MAKHSKSVVKRLVGSAQGRRTCTTPCSGQLTLGGPGVQVGEELAAVRVTQGDTDRIDTYIHPDATIWDAEQPDLVQGRSGLNAIRSSRQVGPDAPVVIDVVAESPVIDIFDDFAVDRHYLTVHYAADGHASDRIRNTGVWRRTSEGWKIVHNHEDLLTIPSGSKES